MTTTLTKSRLEVQKINSHHEGAEFGVFCLEESDSQFSLGECLSLLREDGWLTQEEIPGTRAGVHKFLVSRKK